MAKEECQLNAENAGFKLPAPVTEALEMLEASGHEAYVVGGCVRDLCRGVLPHDYDITTSAFPDETEACFSGFRIIETGMKHGTVTVIVGGEPIEITTYRTDGKYLDGRHPESVTFSRRIEDDLSRRDFTVNAMAYSPRRGFRDFFGGRRDLEARVIACVGEPDRRFGEDGLRIMRALRFASSLGFDIDEKTAASVHRNRALLGNISAERILAEYKRLIVGEGADRILILFEDVMYTVMPELHDLGHKTYMRAVHAASSARPDVSLRTAILLYDEKNLPALRRLKPDGKLLSSVGRILSYLKDDFPRDRVTLRRMLRRCPYEDARRAVEARHALGLMSEADAASAAEEICRMEAEGECVTVRQLAVSGGELMAMGVPEGERLGVILEALLEEVITERIPNEREALLNFAAGMI